MLPTTNDSNNVLVGYSPAAVKVIEESIIRNKKNHAVSMAVFNCLNNTFQGIKDYFFVSAEKNVTEQKKEKLGYMEKVVSKALVLVKTNKIPKEAAVAPAIQVNKYATYAYEASILAAPIYLFVESQFSGQLSFMQQQATLQAAAESLKPSLSAFFGGSIDKKQMESHGMLLIGDGIDHTLYQFGTLSVATLANAATFNLLNPQIQLISSLASLPPVENAIMSLKVPQLVSQKTHEMNSKLRKMGADFIKPYVVSIIEPKLISAAAAAEKAFLAQFEVPVIPGFGKMGDKFLKANVHHLVTKPMTNMIAQGIDTLTNKASEQIVDMAFDQLQQMALAAMQLRLDVKIVNSQTTYMKNPLFDGLALILAGGPWQSPTEFASRVLGAGILTATGQKLLPLTIIYTPKILTYIAKLQESFAELEAEEIQFEEIIEDSGTEETSSEEGVIAEETSSNEEITVEEKGSFFENLVTSFFKAESEVEENNEYYMGMY